LGSYQIQGKEGAGTIWDGPKSLARKTLLVLGREKQLGTNEKKKLNQWAKTGTSGGKQLTINSKINAIKKTKKWGPSPYDTHTAREYTGQNERY